MHLVNIGSEIPPLLPLSKGGDLFPTPFLKDSSSPPWEKGDEGRFGESSWKQRFYFKAEAESSSR
jgi:hypothetical protein